MAVAGEGMSSGGDVGGERQRPHHPCAQLARLAHRFCALAPLVRVLGKCDALHGFAAGSGVLAAEARQSSGTSFGTIPIQPTMPSALTMAAATNASS